MAQAFNTFYAGSGMKPNAFCLEGSAAPRSAGAHAVRRKASRFSGDSRNLRFQTSVTAQHRPRAAPAMARGRQHRSGCTGQQVGFSWVALHGSQAASAIAVARTLSAETGQRCVSSLLAANGIHDFAEVATATSPWTEQSASTDAGARPELEGCSLAERLLGDDVRGLIDDWASLAGLDARTK